jgi:hypothetical protein
MISVGHSDNSSEFSKSSSVSDANYHTINSSKLQGLVRLEGLGKVKKLIDLHRPQTHNLPACNIVPQLTTLPHAPIKHIVYRYSESGFHAPPAVSSVLWTLCQNWEKEK